LEYFVALTPKDAVLFDLYTSLAERIAAGARSALEMINGPQESRKELAKRVGAIESEADELLGKIIRRIDDMFVTPYDRGDLQELANKLDDAMDEIEEATDLIILHDVKEFPQGLTDLVDAVRRLAELTASSMPRLKNLKDLDHYYSEADRIETEGDRIHRRVTSMLFSGNFDALTILRINGVIDAFEEALDEMARVARTIRTIALKES
jgi:predicted phosphate transport protein (TIGR00153 family)